MNDDMLNVETPSVLIMANIFMLMTCLLNHLKRQKQLAGVVTGVNHFSWDVLMNFFHFCC